MSEIIRGQETIAFCKNGAPCFKIMQKGYELTFTLALFLEAVESKSDTMIATR